MAVVRTWRAWAAIVVINAAACAQSAVLTGHVQGADGPVAGAEVRACPTIPRGKTEGTLSDPAGNFRISDLRPGVCRVSVVKSSFVPFTARVTLRAGANHLGVRLQPSARASSAPAPSNTPLNGRDWTQLAALAPGVSGVETESTAQGHTAQRGFGAALSISGARPEENDYVLDGVSISDYSNGAPGSVVGATLGVDAVQRISALDANYTAAVGRTGGGVISAITRSGGDAWHGNLYEFLRNSALDARNFFDARRPPFRRNQFGASAGGPLASPHWSVFADFEGLRQALGVTQVDTVPSPAARAGRLASGAVTVDPQVAGFLAALYPLPNGPLLGQGDTGIYSFSGQQITGENYLTARLDWRRSNETISAVYSHDGSMVNEPDAFNDLISNVISRRQLLVLSDQRRWSAATLNSARFGFSRAVAVDGGLSRILNAIVLDPALGMVPGEFVGSIAAPGLTTLPGGPAADLAHSNSSKSFAWNSFQGYDDAALLRAGQSIQFGAMLERMQSDVGINTDANGNFSFGSLRDLLLNQPLAFNASQPGPLNIFGLRQILAAAYVEDAFKPTSSLNLSAGLRYEFTTVPSEAHNRIANLQHLTDPVARLGAPYFLNPTLRDFSPRLGLQWQPWQGNLVESGFGVFDVLPLPYEFNIITPETYPYLRQIVATALAPGTFPTAAYQDSASSPSLFRTSYVEHDPRRNYVMQWNLTLQHQLHGGTTFSAGYVGSRSVHLPLRRDDFNTVMPELTPAGYVYPPLANSQRLNPDFGRISGVTWNDDGYYDALQSSFTASTGHGTRWQLAYTWSKSLDTGTATVTADQYDNSLVNMPFFNTRLNRGPSDLNIGQILVANFTWQFVPASPSPGAHAFTSGWQMDGVFKASSGTPFTAELGGDPLGTKLSAVTEVPNVLSGPDCGSLVNPGNPINYIRTQCFAFPQPADHPGDLGRNALTGPGLINLDLSLIKDTSAHWLDRNATVQFRAEFFNLFNRPDFASPLNHLAVFDAAGTPIQGAGLITSTVEPQREIQLAIKLIY